MGCDREPYTDVYFTEPTGSQNGAAMLRYSEIIIAICSAVVMLYSYVKILMIVRQHHLTISATTTVTSIADHQLESQQGGLRAVSVKSAKSIFIITVVFYISYIPSELLTENRGMVIPLWYDILFRMVVFSSPVANSLIYIFMFKSKRKDFCANVLQKMLQNLS